MTLVTVVMGMASPARRAAVAAYEPPPATALAMVSLGTRPGATTYRLTLSTSGRVAATQGPGLRT